MKQLKKSRHGDYEKVIKLPVFSNYKIHIVFTDDIRASSKARYPHSDGFDERADAGHQFSNSGDSHLYYTTANSFGVLAHEVVHAIFSIFDWIGARKRDEEVEAYHLGYICDAVVDFRDQVLDSKAVKSQTKKVKK